MKKINLNKLLFCETIVLIINILLWAVVFILGMFDNVPEVVDSSFTTALIISYFVIGISFEIILVMSIVSIAKGFENPLKNSLILQIFASICSAINFVMAVLIFLAAAGFILVPPIGPVISIFSVVIGVFFVLLSSFFIILSAVPNIAYIIYKVKKYEWKLNLKIIVLAVLQFIIFGNIASTIILKTIKDEVIDLTSN
ncbi:MAG: hypothetical protein MJZ37_02140 [Bacilli bacterium]|nr:hypothetical protein [Bacilli bacterium]